MPLLLKKLEDADVEESIRMAHRAHFANGGLAVLAYRSQEIHPDELKSMAEKRRKAMADSGDRVALIKVIDTDLGHKMIAYSNWQISPHGQTQEELDEVSKRTPAASDSPAPQAWDDLTFYLSESRKKYLGLAPAVFLKGLITDPAHQRRGAGSMLVKWGTDKADELGIRGYLEATSAGRPLYEKYGFKVLFEQAFDLAKYGGTGVQHDFVMERPAKGRLT